MRHLIVLFIHFISTLGRLLGPGGVRSLVAESLLLKHQLLILNRSRKRSPNLSSLDRIRAGWMALLVRPTRLLRSAVVLKPATLLALHKVARITHWKGERRIRPRSDQPPISARLDGGLTVASYIRRQWLRDFPKTLDRCDIGRTRQDFQEIIWCYSAGNSWLRSLHCSLPPCAFGSTRSGESDAAHFRSAIHDRIASRITIRHRRVKSVRTSDFSVSA